MKERPILFSAPMIRALLAGKKTQTRRLVRPQPERVPDWSCPGVDGLRFVGMTLAEPPLPPNLLARCPYGVPGDRLWVKETWTHDSDSDDEARAHHEDAMVSLSTAGVLVHTCEKARCLAVAKTLGASP